MGCRDELILLLRQESRVSEDALNVLYDLCIEENIALGNRKIFRSGSRLWSHSRSGFWSDPGLGLALDLGLGLRK